MLTLPLNTAGWFVKTKIMWYSLFVPSGKTVLTFVTMICVVY